MLILAAISLFIIILVFVNDLLGIETAIKGTYLLLSLILAFSFYSRSGTKGEDPSYTPTAGRFFRPNKLIVILSAICLTVGIGFDRASLAFLVFVPTSYIVIINGIGRKRVSGQSTLFQILIVFATPLVVIVRETGFYFAGGDLLKHRHYVNLLYSTGRPNQIPSLYADFPGQHIVIGAVSGVSNLTINTSFLLTGITIFSFVGIVILLKYYLLHFSSELSLFAVTGLTAILPINTFALYFYPQSMAIWLLVLSIYSGHRWLKIGDARHGLLGIVGSISAVYVHHFTFILVVPIALYYISYGIVLQGRNDWKIVGGLLIGYLTAMAYWVFASSEFLVRFITFTSGLFEAGLFNTGNEQSVSSYYYGVEPTIVEGIDAFSLLVPPAGIYYILLGFILIVGGVVTLVKKEILYPEVAIGVMSAPLLLKLPISVKSITRVQLLFAIFAAVILGKGIKNILDSTKPRRVIATLLVVVFLTIGTGASVETIAEPSYDKQFQFEEYDQLKQVGKFTKKSSNQPSTFWTLNQGLYSHGYESKGYLNLTKERIRYGSGLFIYKYSWPSYTITSNILGPYSANVRLGKTWLETSLTCSNKVYVGQEYGVLYSNQHGRLPAAYDSSNCP